MKKIIIFSILGFFLLSCSANKNSENKLEESDGKEKATSDSIQSKESNGLALNIELIEDCEEEKAFDPSSNLTVIPIESYKYDLDSDGQLDKVELFNFKEYSNDPGDFQRIRIELANGKVLDEYNLGIRDSDYMSIDNEIESDLITIVKYKDFTFLMTYGWNFASDPPRLTIYDFSSDEPRRIFAQNFATKEVILKNDILITGYKSLKETDSDIEPELYELGIRDNQLNIKSL
jgi:hypothetical protein